MSTVVTVPSNVVEKLRQDAEKRGLTLDEYLVELALQNMDPPQRAVEYINAAKELLEQAKQELEKGSVRQAAEKAWGATALAIKAYAAWREGRRLASHGELWEYEKIMVRELGEWIHDSWMSGQGMHVCFYEGWCDREHVEEALKRIERLVTEVAKRILRT